MADVADRASSDDSGKGKKFATAQANYSALQSVYGLAQCTPDLSDSDCNGCLLNGMSKLPDDAKQGARVLFPSCYVWYEVYPFFNASIGVAPPPPSSVLPPPASSPGNGGISSQAGNGGISSQVIIAIVVPICVAIIIFIAGFYILTRRAKKKCNSLREDNAPLHLMDPTQKAPYSKDEVIKCIHIALLCVQDDPCARPSMATVVAMLDGYFATLSLPQQPAFHGWSRTGLELERYRSKPLELERYRSKPLEWSVNEVSISELEPR
ncbi:hypothetical protein C3L33_06374, partial [Rhododendron williamsianum]